eukprot:Hpha_TRINITY_DN27663_c0_g1::TRINITY_DN27663_c0_g1_i1::g.57355::m.57355
MLPSRGRRLQPGSPQSVQNSPPRALSRSCSPLRHGGPHSPMTHPPSLSPPHRMVEERHRTLPAAYRGCSLTALREAAQATEWWRRQQSNPERIGSPSPVGDALFVPHSTPSIVSSSGPGPPWLRHIYDRPVELRRPT